MLEGPAPFTSAALAGSLRSVQGGVCVCVSVCEKVKNQYDTPAPHLLHLHLLVEYSLQPVTGSVPVEEMCLNISSKCP